MFDIIYIGDKTDNQYTTLKNKFPTAKFADSFYTAQKKCLTKFLWVVWPDLEVADDFEFDYIPDDWSTDYTHTFLNGEYYDGIVLVPKNASISEKEIKHRFFINKKEVEIIASTPKSFDLFYVDTWEEYEHAFNESTTELFWAVSRNLTYNEDYINKFYFSHHNSYDRQENHTFVHKVNNESLHNGVFLCSKHKPLNDKQINYRFLVNSKQWEDVVSGPCKYEIFNVTSYEDYLDCVKKSKTEMFWIIPSHVKTKSDFKFDMYFSHDNDFDRKINHVFLNGKFYDGITLCSKHCEITQKEFDYQFITNKKEHNIVASYPTGYDIFTVNNYEDFCNAKNSTTTDFFYVVPSSVNVTFDFDYQISYHQKDNIHVFKNGKYHDGIFLIHKDKKLAQREFDYRFFIHKKEVDIQASTPKPYDIVFISYQEPNADENYERILERFPNCKRVHGVKGIHQAHIEGAKLCDTDMFWIIDGDAIIVDDFNFDYQVARWDKETVHVWRSQNPINDMVYGYGGIKLFPTELTINMDTSKPDMTTSISSKFKAVQEISNITAFNTGPFETWKSAFRECAKLSSKVIDRQKDDETNERLETWTTVGHDRPYGKYALAGATAGMEFGLSNSVDLTLINDFDWLKEQFDANL